MSTLSGFTFLPLGAIIQSFVIDDINIVQGFPTQSLYQSHNGPFFGENIGRVANRIKNAKIDNLNGKSYQLEANNGPNALHGGSQGWGKKIWKGPTAFGTKEIKDVEALKGGESVKFTYTSEDGDGGYPGTVEATIIYTTGTESTAEGKEVQVLGIEYQVELVSGAEETVINTTNHSYFNLTGEPTITGTEISLCTNQYLPVDDSGIPTSGPSPYPNITPNQPFTLGFTEPDIDDCFTLTTPYPFPSSIPLDTRSLPLTRLVAAYHPTSNIHLEVLSTEPAFQFYTGKYIDVPAVKTEEGVEVRARGARSGFCVEPSRFVNAVNVEEWRDMVLLRQGEVYGSRIVYKGWSGK